MKILIFTDLHYTDKPVGNDGRYHAMSINKVKEALQNYSEGCEFAVCMGDIVDGFDGYKTQEQGLEELSEMWTGFDLPFYAMIGNHDTSLDKREFCRLAGMPHRYYSVETDEFLCLMLDTNMNSKDEPYPEKEIFWPECFVDGEQLEWAREKINASSKPVIVFTHALLDFDSDEVRNDHVLMNADEVKEVLFEAGKVCAVFSGHYHYGQHMYYDGVPGIVFTSVCNEPTNNFAVVEINKEGIRVEGHGTQPDYEIKF